MLRQRLLVALVLLPIGVISIIYGGWVFTALIALILGLAAWEYSNIFRSGGHHPAAFIIIPGVLSLLLVRACCGFDYDAPLLAFFILLTMGVHLVAYERGANSSGVDFCITLTGIVYLGLLGSYFPLLRGLPDGMWWTFTLLPAIWWADTGAYFIGKKYGVHRLAPRLSPKKSWEGYIAGILFSLAGTPLLVLLYYRLGLSPDSAITLPRAALLGLVLSALPTLGDLGVSMIKRQFGVKDSGEILPGHGGFLDRTDSWLWGLVIGYYIITCFFLAG